MDLNISNYPFMPKGNLVGPYNPQGTPTETKPGNPSPGFVNNAHINDAAIISLSPEALTHESQDNQQLSPEEKQIVQKLQLVDLHVKMHEQQHLAAAGSYAKGGASFHYMNGPDGKLYAVGGEVALDTSPIPNNPQATIVKAQVLKRAALAPSDPSGADRAIAAAAIQMEAQARNELANQKIKKSSSQSESNTINTGNNTHYFIKAYRHQLQSNPSGKYFNKIA